MGEPLVGVIPLSSYEHAGTELWHMADRFFGGGMTAGRLHAELQPAIEQDGLETVRGVLHRTSTYVNGPLVTELNGIKADLAAAYQGSATDQMSTQFEGAVSTCQDMSPKFTGLATQVNQTQDALGAAWKTVGGYSRVGSDLSNVGSVFGGESDDDKASDAWNTCKSSLQAAGSGAAQIGGGDGWHPSTEYQPPKHTGDPNAAYQNPGATGPGPGNFGPGPGPGFTGPGPGGPGPGYTGPGPGYTGPGGPGYTGPGPGGPGPGYTGPGPGGPGPGYTGPGPGYSGPGGYGPGPGASIDSGSQLAGYTGPGPGGVGPGGPGGLGSDTAGGLAGAGGGLGSGAGGADAAGAGAAGARGTGAVPLGGRGGGGGGGDSDRERSTWLTEEDDVWGESDAPDGVIS